MLSLPSLLSILHIFCSYGGCTGSGAAPCTLWEATIQDHCTDEPVRKRESYVVYNSRRSIHLFCIILVQHSI